MLVPWFYVWFLFQLGHSHPPLLTKATTAFRKQGPHGTLAGTRVRTFPWEEARGLSLCGPSAAVTAQPCPFSRTPALAATQLQQHFDSQPKPSLLSITVVCLLTALCVNTSLARAAQDRRQSAQRGLCAHCSSRLDRSQGSAGLGGLACS